MVTINRMHNTFEALDAEGNHIFGGVGAVDNQRGWIGMTMPDENGIEKVVASVIDTTPTESLIDEPATLRSRTLELENTILDLANRIAELEAR